MPGSLEQPFWLRMFISYTGVTPEKPALVLLDNHTSRFDATMREEAEAHGVISPTPAC